MASDPTFVEYVFEQSGLGPRMSTTRTFGEWALRLDGCVVGFICRNSLFIKPLESTDMLTRGLPRRPPFHWAKPWCVADALLDDPARLAGLLKATADAVRSR